MLTDRPSSEGLLSTLENDRANLCVSITHVAVMNWRRSLLLFLSIFALGAVGGIALNEDLSFGDVQDRAPQEVDHATKSVKSELGFNVPENPWLEETIHVQVIDQTSSERAVRPLVNEGIRYWNRNMSRLGYEGQFQLVEKGSETPTPDVIVYFVRDIGECGVEKSKKYVGCATLNNGTGSADSPTKIRIEDSYSDSSTETTITHEFGHTLGLRHTDANNWSIMKAGRAHETVPVPNATAKANPWEREKINVYYNLSALQEDESDAENVPNITIEIGPAAELKVGNESVEINESDEGDTIAVGDDEAKTGDEEAESESVNRTARAIEEFNSTLDYYSGRTHLFIPRDIEFHRVHERSEAQIELRVVEEVDGGVSSATWRGVDPDGDGALEIHTNAVIKLDKSLVTDVYAWHAGYWIGMTFGVEDQRDLPDPFTGEDAKEQRDPYSN